jgi:hypothetical protein
MDTEADGRWMTFGELAAERGINKASAHRLVRRHKWRRQTDNRGTVRVLVPLDWLEAQGDRPSDSPTANPSDNSPAINALEAAIATLREQLDTAKGLIEAERIRADRAEQARDVEQHTTERRIEAERNRADRAEQGRDAADKRAVLAEGRADRAEQASAAELHTAKGWIETERTRADSERSRADRAEQGRDGERTRADALRERIDALQSQLAEAHVHADQARADAQEATRAAEAVRAIAEARKPKGLLAVIRAAWRGDRTVWWGE